jgi:DnaJ like chaperone protein
MPKSSREPVLPARVETGFYDLLNELNACNHKVSKLIARKGLPRWSRGTLFYFLGYIAKADGRVTPADVSFTESLIEALELSPRQRRRAIRQFTLGKAADNPPLLRGARLRATVRFWPWAALRVVICLAHAAQLNGRPSRTKRYRCEDALVIIGLPLYLLGEIFDSYARKVWATRAELQPLPDTYAKACKLLGVGTRENLDKIKQAYRRRVSECHPDKLPRDMSPEDLLVAKERLWRYQTAWELIKRRYRAN